MQRVRPRLTLAALVLVTACGKAQDAPAPPSSAAPQPLAPRPAPAPAAVRPGPLCTYHGVCWASPLPQGNALHAVRALAPDRVIAVGDRGTVLAWDGHTWSLEDTPTRERLLALAQAPSGELFAVGERGTLLRRGAGGAGATWTAMVSGTDATLRAIVAAAANDVLVGGDGLALHFDGAAWTRESLPAAAVPDGTSLVAFALHEGVVHALGSSTSDGGAPQRAILARDASGWHALSTVAADVGSLCSLPDGSLVLSGSSARHGDGRTWQERPFGADRPLDAVWCGAAGADVWAAGYEGRLAQWDGHSWHHEQLDTRLDVDAVDGTSTNDVWAVGEHGLIAHRDATAWTILSSGTTSPIEGVFGLAREDVWAVGDHVALHYDGKAWTPGGPADTELDALYGSGGGLLAVGKGGAIRRYAGGAWTREPSGTTATLEGVWASDDTHAIAVGGEWTKSDGIKAWQRIAGRPWATAIWGSSASEVWAAGNHGLEHWDGTRWAPVAGTDGAPLFAVWGASHDDVWAAGASGHLLHFDGTTWSPVDGGAVQDLFGLWGRSARDVWAVGQHGTLLHWDGGHWQWRDSGTDERLHAVWGAPGGETWIVGHGGVVLRVGPT